MVKAGVERKSLATEAWRKLVAVSVLVSFLGTSVVPLRVWAQTEPEADSQPGVLVHELKDEWDQLGVRSISSSPKTHWQETQAFLKYKLHPRLMKLYQLENYSSLLEDQTLGPQIQELRQLHTRLTLLSTASQGFNSCAPSQDLFSSPSLSALFPLVVSASEKNAAPRSFKESCFNEANRSDFDKLVKELSEQSGILLTDTEGEARVLPLGGGAPQDYLRLLEMRSFAIASKFWVETAMLFPRVLGDPIDDRLDFEIAEQNESRRAASQMGIETRGKGWNRVHYSWDYLGPQLTDSKNRGATAPERLWAKDWTDFDPLIGESANPYSGEKSPIEQALSARCQGCAPETVNLAKAAVRSRILQIDAGQKTQQIPRYSQPGLLLRQLNLAITEANKQAKNSSVPASTDPMASYLAFQSLPYASLLVSHTFLKFQLELAPQPTGILDQLHSMQNRKKRTRLALGCGNFGCPITPRVLAKMVHETRANSEALFKKMNKVRNASIPVHEKIDFYLKLFPTAGAEILAEQPNFSKLTCEILVSRDAKIAKQDWLVDASLSFSQGLFEAALWLWGFGTTLSGAKLVLAGGARVASRLAGREILLPQLPKMADLVLAGTDQLISRAFFAADIMETSFTTVVSVSAMSNPAGISSVDQSMSAQAGAGEINSEVWQACKNREESIEDNFNLTCFSLPLIAASIRSRAKAGAESASDAAEAAGGATQGSKNEPSLVKTGAVAFGLFLVMEITPNDLGGARARLREKLKNPQPTPLAREQDLEIKGVFEVRGKIRVPKGTGRLGGQSHTNQAIQQLVNQWNKTMGTELRMVIPKGAPDSGRVDEHLGRKLLPLFMVSGESGGSGGEPARIWLPEIVLTPEEVQFKDRVLGQTATQVGPLKYYPHSLFNRDVDFELLLSAVFDQVERELRGVISGESAASGVVAAKLLSEVNRAAEWPGQPLQTLIDLEVKGARYSIALELKVSAPTSQGPQKLSFEVLDVFPALAR